MLSAELSTKDFENKLSIFTSSLGNIFENLLKAVGEEMANNAKNKAVSAFTNRTGKLFNSIKFIVNKDLAALTTKKNLNKGNIYYAKFIEYGADIKPKNKEYLTFKVNGQWVKVKNVKTRPRPFMIPTWDEYFGTNGKGYQSLAEQLENKMNEELG